MFYSRGVFHGADGGGKAWRVRRHGDIGVSFQWVNDEPAMILFPLCRTLGGAYVICLSAAWKYADSTSGAPTPYLVQQSVAAAAQMGFSETDRFAARRVAGIIVDSLPDLVAMPPEPVGLNAETAQNIGELSLKVDGETVLETEVAA